MKKCYAGIDLCDAQAVLSVWDDADEGTLCPKKYPSWYPSVLMPSQPNEQPLFGPQYGDHRRGQGLLWPPESQIPYRGDVKWGLPRIPLTVAWWQLTPYHDDVSYWDDYSIGKKHMAWTPIPGGSPIQISPENAIVGTALACLDDAKLTPDQCTLVVPDDFGEGAQQAVLDVWKQRTSIPLHLVPRPVAVAMEWCSLQHAEEYAARPADKNGAIGHVMVLHLGMDRWECTCLNIRVQKHDGRTFLVPVRDHTLMTSALPTTGLRWLLARSTVSKTERWNDVFCSGLFQRLKQHSTSVSLREWDQASSAAAGLLQEWFGAAYEVAADSYLMADIKAKIEQKYRNQIASGNLHDELLYTLVSGPLARVRVDQNKLGRHLVSGLTRETPMLGTGSICGSGAAAIARQLGMKLPTYYDRLAPIDIFTNKQNEYLDWDLYPVNLIPDKTMEAGQEYRSQQLRGFSIQAGQQIVKFEFQRVSSKMVYRGVSATLRSKCEYEQSLFMTATAKPGQGRAAVNIQSTSGLVNEHLDWRTLSEIPKPEAIDLAWPPGMAVVHFDDGYFSSARFWLGKMSRAISDCESLSDMYRYADNSREEIRNWKKYKSYEVPGSRLPDDRIFQYFGVIPSHKSAQKTELLEYLTPIAEWLESNVKTVMRGKPLRLFCSWLYEYCPTEVVHQCVLKVKELDCDDSHLAVAGNCAVSEEDIAIFASSFAAAIRRGVANNNWLRAYRNLVRFRIHSVSNKLVDDMNQNRIVEHVLATIREEISTKTISGQSVIFNNCLRSLPHILKRRKFDPAFLDPKSVLGMNTIRLLNELEGMLFLAQWQQQYVQLTLKFIERKATMDDVRAMFIGDGDA